jgi:hypothetical protein
MMDLAESHMRNAGYGGFSFRDLAAEIGIKRLPSALGETPRPAPCRRAGSSACMPTGLQERQRRGRMLWCPQAEADNLPSILQHGLMSTERLLSLVGMPEAERATLLRRHRPDSFRLSESVLIRDQRPMRLLRWPGR